MEATQNKHKIKLNARQYGMGIALVAIMFLFQILTRLSISAITSALGVWVL